MDSAENGDLVPRPHLIEPFNRIFEWFEAPGTNVSLTESSEGTPQRHLLTQNHPNPFNCETKITFQIPESEHVTITVHNLLGHKMKTLVDERMEAGLHTVIWNGTDTGGQEAPSGVYFYRLVPKNGSWSEAKSMVFLK